MVLVAAGCGGDAVRNALLRFATELSAAQERQDVVKVLANVDKFLSFLHHALKRTKSPPLAVTYTYLFLMQKNQEELSLDILRFISQLADLSPGVSMSGSLHNILS